MGAVHLPRPALLVVAAFSRHAEALAWARDRAAAAWGPLALESPRFEFQQTSYYERSMGSDLRKTLFACAPLIDPARLVDLKLQANDWEEEYAALASHPEPRPLNVDPGYLTLAKLVLATTKDRDHRVYLARGVYAEVTLHHQGGAWRPRPWTYPDYQSPEYHAFFEDCRELLRRKLAELG